MSSTDPFHVGSTQLYLYLLHDGLPILSADYHSVWNGHLVLGQGNFPKWEGRLLLQNPTFLWVIFFPVVKKMGPPWMDKP